MNLILIAIGIPVTALLFFGGLLICYKSAESGIENIRATKQDRNFKGQLKIYLLMFLVALYFIVGVALLFYVFFSLMGIK